MATNFTEPDVYVTDHTIWYTDSLTEEIRGGFLSTTERLSDLNVTTNVANSTDDGFLFEEFVVTPYLICGIVASALGILGNALVLGATMPGRTKESSTTALVRALAVADMMTSVLIYPSPEAVRVPHTLVGELYCRVMYSHILLWSSIVASIFTLTAISVDRYIAIAYPFFYIRSVTSRRTVIVIVLIRILSLVININPLFVYSIHAEDKVCVEHYRVTALKRIYGVIIFVLEFLLPTVIMLFTYLRASYILNTEITRFQAVDKTHGVSSDHRQSLISVAKKRNLVSLLIVVITFIVCWGPNQVYYLLINLGVLGSEYLDSNVLDITIALAFINSCANPVIYTIRFPKFRAAIASLFSCSGGKGRKVQMNIFMTDMGSTNDTTATDMEDLSPEVPPV